MHISSRLGSSEAVLILLSNGATRDATTKDNYTPLHIAVKEGHEDVVELLLDNGAKQDITTKVTLNYQGKLAKQAKSPLFIRSVFLSEIGFEVMLVLFILLDVHCVINQ